MHDLFYELLSKVLMALGTLAMLGMLYLIERAIAWLRTKISADRAAALSSAIDKLIMFGVTQATTAIEQHGWDARGTKETVKQIALASFERKFPEALKMNKLDLENSGHRALVAEAIDRAIPDVFTRAAASPATPPAPIDKPPAAVVSAPA